MTSKLYEYLENYNINEYSRKYARVLENTAYYFTLCKKSFRYNQIFKKDTELNNNIKELIKHIEYLLKENSIQYQTRDNMILVNYNTDMIIIINYQNDFSIEIAENYEFESFIINNKEDMLILFKLIDYDFNFKKYKKSIS